MRKRILSLLLCCVMLIGLLPTAAFAAGEIEEQFTLTPGGRYYFDLSAMDIPGTVNSGNSFGMVSLPDTSLHYVPFTYAGTIEAYKLTSAMATTEEYAQQNKYPHSLFVADYAVTHTVSWNGLNDEGLIFGKNYASGGVDYTLRAPSVGSNATGSGDSQRGVPQSNEWDTMLNKNSGYIKNWNGIYSWGQDTTRYNSSFRAVRGFISARLWGIDNAASSDPNVVFRPVLEILNPDTLGSDGLKVVTLDLGGGTLGNSSEDIQIIVKTGSEFPAPASDGMTRPNGDTGSYFMWLDGNGNSYEPGDSVPADVTALTVQWTDPTYTVTLHPNGGTINSGNVTEYTYGVGAALPTADDMTYTGHTFKGWYDNENLTGSPVTAIGGTEMGNKEYWAKWEANTYTVTLNTNGGTINSGNVTGYTYGVGATLPTAGDMDYTGHTFKGWYDNESLTGSPVTAIGDTETGNKEYWAKWEANTYTVTLNTNGGTINSGNVTGYTYGVGATLPTAGDMTYTGHTFKGWYDNENLTGDPVTAIGGTEMGNKEYWAKWEINQYTITVKPENGKADITITQDYGTPITAPADPTRNGYTFVGWDKAIPATMPAENLTITAQWTINQYTITFDTAGGSEIAPITQDYGTPITAPAAPIRTGYTFAGWSPALPAAMPAENMTVTAQWRVNRYTITFDTAGGSAIAPITQDYGTAITAPADPTRNGYTFAGWSPALPATMPAENMTVTAQWRVNRYTITYDLDRGTADDNPTGYTVETETFTLKNPTRPGYIFSGWSGTGLTGKDNLTVTIPKGSTGNRSYTAHWRYNGGYRYYTIKATAGAGGSISPNGNVSVREGSDRTFTITPDKGYAVSNVKIDGKSIGAVRSYTFENVRHAHTIEASFMKAGGSPQTGVFVDVATGSYYEDAVDWAVENGVTTGVSANRFDPNGVCTRAQAVTFLWRAAGSPAPRSRTMPFTDVPAGSYYYDAVLWAVENGITKGTSDTTFSPNMTCTRAQIVAFLWRSEKSPAAGTANPFADVKSTAYYAGAVLWAVKEDITKGTTGTTFSPNADCTRAQIVTFLWRCKK